jgi:hypothetical protein
LYNFIRPVFSLNWALVINILSPPPKFKFNSLTKAEELTIPVNSFTFPIKLSSSKILEENLISVLDGDISEIKNGLRHPFTKSFL